MNLRLLHSGLPHSLQPSLPLWQLPLKPRWTEQGESPGWSLTQIAIVGWILGFTGAVLFHLAWPGVSPFRVHQGRTPSQVITSGAFQ